MAEEMIYTMANTKIFIGENPVNAKLEVTPADFQDVNWIEIKGLFNIGELGGEQAVNEFELINSDWMMKSKGTRNGGTMTNTFIPIHLDPGQEKFREAIEDNCRPYPFRLERGANCAPEANVTIAIGAPGVITWAGHDFTAGQPIMFSTDEGTLPTSLTAGTAYYVVADGLTDDAFSVALTPGGAAIETAEASTGTVVGTAPPAGMVDIFQGFALDGARSGGARNDQFTRAYGIAVNGRVVTI